MGKPKQGDARPAYSLEKEAVREEIQTGLQTGVEILAGNVEKGKETDHFHNTKYLLKQYRRVEYSIRISEADLNLRMEMQHGMRLSTLEVNSELAGIDLTGTKLENHARSVIRSKNMLEIINAALEAVREDPDRGDLLYHVLYITYFSKSKPRNRTQILIELDMALVLDIVGTPYSWIVDTSLPPIEFASFGSVLTVIVGCLASGSVSLIVIILVIIIAWNYLKLLFEAAERYIMVGVLIFTAPVAFATGASESTSNIFSSWCRMLGGQLFLLIMNAWCLRLFVSMVGTFLANPLSV